LILPTALALALAVPAAASATVVAPGLSAPHDGLLVKIDHKAKHRGKGHGKGGHDYDNWDDRRGENRAYREGYYEGRREAERDYRRYSRGQYLPREYRSYVVNDYSAYGYPPPPRGCRYVRVGQDTYLTQIATGLILNAILGGRY
jgi:Ni/Co efflux regulator RcnB